MARKPNRIRERRRESNVSRRTRSQRRVVDVEVQAVSASIPPDFSTTVTDFEARIAGLENPQPQEP